ncbi:MAG: tRNA (adenosine(37)-N6)-threonylcarbamoyltransferase complex ATPase subunit type 1 TsaE [Clostridia bacterium]|nr:tRNA (adenosine(37)-N6)-threonylcarbamoyltransferase complex ATPase subunit type 1 TsaE [Clostridia bacterium]
MAEFISHSADETISFAERYARSLKGGDIVLLKGELGAGKTVFCKGLAKGLGVEDEILSPTYAYMNDYSGKLYHFDCYRLANGEQAEGLGLTDYFYMDGICVIEWAENIASVLPSGCREVEIEKIGDTVRRIVYD